MNNLRPEKTDVISAILENHDLLNTFSNTLETVERESTNEVKENPIDEALSLSFSKIQKAKLLLWKKMGECLRFLSEKMQTLAVLTEYSLKTEMKKVREAFSKETDDNKYKENQ